MSKPTEVLVIRPALTEEQAAEYLNVAARTLQKWRCRGDGPPFIKTSKRHIRYRQADLDAWQDAHLVSSTSEYTVKIRGVS